MCVHSPVSDLDNWMTPMKNKKKKNVRVKEGRHPKRRDGLPNE